MLASNVIIISAVHLSMYGVRHGQVSLRNGTRQYVREMKIGMRLFFANSMRRMGSRI